MVFELDLNLHIVRAHGTEIPMVLVGKNRDPWFRGFEVAEHLGYAQPKVALTKHLGKKGKNTRTLGELLPDIVSITETMRSSDKRKRWINEPGVYRLVGHSEMPAAEAFQDWIYEEVLPSIRKTGSYNINKPEEHANATPWQQGRVDGIELCKLKNASLHTLLTHLASSHCAAGRLYAMVGCAVNRAVLDTKLSKKELFEAKQLPTYMSVPDFLDFDGHLSRQYVERAFQSFLEKNMERLKGQSFEDTKEELEKLGETMRQAAIDTGCYVGLMDKMLNLEEARAYKRELEKVRKSGLVKASFTDPMLKCREPVIKKRARQTTLGAAGAWKC